MAGFSNDVNNKDIVFADNVDFTGSNLPTGQITTDGQLLIGSSVSPNIRTGLLTSSDNSITWTFGHGTISGQVTGGITAIKTITGNTGGAESPSAGNFNFLTANTTVKFAGTAATETLDFGLSNILLGSSGSSISGAIQNVAIGSNALNALVSGSGNVGVGYNSLLITTGSLNTALGSSTLTSLTTGIHNTVIGQSAGSQYSSSESSNILIKNIGSTGESNTIRIGTQGSSNGQQNLCFIAGIVGVTNSNPVLTTINSSTGQLGVQALTQYNILTGGASNALNFVAPSATSGVPLISQGAASQPIYGTAVVAGGGTGSVSFNINGAVYSNTTTTGVLQAATLTSGQLLIGGTTTPAAATLTPGTGISISNGNNSITIASTGAGFAWTDVTGATQTIAVQNGYLTDRGGGVTYTLPASASIGDTFKIVGKAGLATITPNANQQLLIGSASGTVGATGTAVATNAGDCITFVCITSGASTVYRAESFVGNWTLN